jgi:Domain of unknown function (DUF4133)
MADKVYFVNKGINKAVEFRGLKAQYIGYVVGVLLGSLVLYGVLYVCGLSGYVCVPLTLGIGGYGVMRVLRLSKKFGQHGMMKWQARRSVPKALLSRSRKVFIEIWKKDGSEIG